MPSKEAQIAMAQWVAAIADNVKNPIAAVAAVLDRIDSNLADAEFVSMSVAQIRKRLGGLNEYISELSDFARPAVIHPSKSNVKSLVTVALDNAALPSNCSVAIDVPADLQLQLDAGKIAMVLRALFRNAFEAVDNRRLPRIFVCAKALAAGGGIISIEDNGPGLPASDARNAVEPFYTTKEAGTGLGLAVARKYVEAHGGSISFDRSQELGGCRVSLTFPDSQRPSEAFRP